MSVEWRPSDQRVFLDNVSLRVVLHTDGLWIWSVYWPLSHRTEQGRVATEAEAKSAAITAAKGDTMNAALAETVAWQPHEDPARTAYVVQVENDLKYAKLQLQEIVELVGEGGDGSAFGSVESMLAERLDSATDVVASDPLWWTPSSCRAKEGKLELHVWRISLEEWGWSTYVFLKRKAGSGVCATWAEAKTAAIAAARGMR